MADRYRILFDFDTAEEALDFYDKAKAARLVPGITDLYRADDLDAEKSVNRRTYIVAEIGDRWADTALRPIVEHARYLRGETKFAWDE